MEVTGSSWSSSSVIKKVPVFTFQIRNLRIDEASNFLLTKRGWMCEWVGFFLEEFIS